MGPCLKLEAGLENWVDEKNIHVSSFSGQKVLQSGTNYKDNAYGKEALPLEQITLSTRNEDVEVNITGCTKSSEALIMGDTCDDVPECSSSFGDTGSDTGNASAFSDDEVVSYMYAKDPFSSIFFKDCEPALIRRKKLTSHWKSFIRPLRWRCKWIELRLKQLQSQELRYKKELAAYDYRRQLMSANFALDGCNTKSVPLLKGICGKKVMKRKKRKRVEETCNLASYTFDHYGLSYNEEKDNAAHARLKNVKDVAEGVAEAQNLESNEEFKWNDNILSHLENDLLSSLDYNDTDKTLMNIIEKIEAAQSEVHKLRARIDKVVNENEGQSSSINNLNTLGHGPSNGLNIYDPKFASLSRMNNTFSARNQFIGKTKESFEEQKSVSLARTSAPDLVAKNAVPNLLSNNFKVCSPSKSNVSRKKRGARKKSGSNWSARVRLVKPNFVKIVIDENCRRTRNLSK